MPDIRYPRNKTCLLIVLLAVAACEPEDSGATEAVAGDCGAGGRLSTRLYGAIDAEVDWHAGDITCEGMPRPDGEGARLRLSGPLDDAPDAATVALILGIPGLGKGMTGRELPTNVTLVQEGSGRFFGTADTDGCWTDVDRHEAVGDDGGSLFRVAGTVYCVSPLAELNGGASISFTELAFSGQLDWEVPE